MTIPKQSIWLNCMPTSDEPARRDRATQRALAVLVSGQAVAQIVPIAASTLLTRLFSPHDYGVFAMITAVAALAAAVVHGRYQRAAVVAEKSADAKALLALSLALSSLLSAALLTTVGVVVAINSAISAIWLAVPILAFVTAASDCFTHHSLRTRQDSRIAQTQILRALSSAGVQISLGYAALGAGGLVAGAIVGGALALVPYLALSRELLVSDRPAVQRLKRLAIEHRRYPLFDLPANMLVVMTYSTLSLVMPILYSPAAAGFLAISLRVLGMPADFIGVALSQVYLRQLADTERDPRTLRRLHWKTAIALAAIATPPCVAVMWVGPSVFAWVFGDPWRPAGQYAAALAPMIWARMIATPFTATFQVAGRQRLLLLMQSALFLTSLGCIFLAEATGASAEQALSIMAAANVVVYVAFFTLATRMVTSIQRSRYFKQPSA